MIRLEFGIEAVKRTILASYFFASDDAYDSDDYEAYVYLDETGEPIFVIEKRT